MGEPICENCNVFPAKVCPKCLHAEEDARHKLEQEIADLRARVQELEKELAARQRYDDAAAKAAGL